MPDPQDHADLEAAGESKAEEAVEDEVLDIVTSTPPEDRSFRGEAKSAGTSADDQPDEADPHVDKPLDHGLKETFPASDPVSINPGAD